MHPLNRSRTNTPSHTIIQTKMLSIDYTWHLKRSCMQTMTQKKQTNKYIHKQITPKTPFIRFASSQHSMAGSPLAATEVLNFAVTSHFEILYCQEATHVSRRTFFSQNGLLLDVRCF